MQITPCAWCKWKATSAMRGCFTHRRLLRGGFTTVAALYSKLDDTAVEVNLWEPDARLELDCPRYEKGPEG